MASTTAAVDSNRRCIVPPFSGVHWTARLRFFGLYFRLRMARNFSRSRCRASKPSSARRIFSVLFLVWLIRCLLFHQLLADRFPAVEGFGMRCRMYTVDGRLARRGEAREP